MHALYHRLWNPQCPVSAFATRRVIADHQYAWLMFEDLPDEVGAEVP
jgi:hypothetical protein